MGYRSAPGSQHRLAKRLTKPKLLHFPQKCCLQGPSRTETAPVPGPTCRCGNIAKGASHLSSLKSDALPCLDGSNDGSDGSCPPGRKRSVRRELAHQAAPQGPVGAAPHSHGEAQLFGFEHQEVSLLHVQLQRKERKCTPSN